MIRTVLLVACLTAWPAFGQEIDIPSVDALEPVTVEPVEAKVYAKQYPVLLVYRYLKDGDAYRPVMQRLTLAPARIAADGSIEVLLDTEEHTTVTNVDLRIERGRSPVFRDMIDDFVQVMGLMANERQLRQSIEAALAEDPEADTSALEATLATIQAALGITE